MSENEYPIRLLACASIEIAEQCRFWAIDNGYGDKNFMAPAILLDYELSSGETHRFIDAQLRREGVGSAEQLKTLFADRVQYAIVKLSSHEIEETNVTGIDIGSICTMDDFLLVCGKTRFCDSFR